MRFLFTIIRKNMLIKRSCLLQITTTLDNIRTNRDNANPCTLVLDPNPNTKYKLQQLVMGTDMPLPSFACPLAKNLMSIMPVPKDFQTGQIPVCSCPQKSPKYEACHRALAKNPDHARKFPNGQMPDVPENF